MKKAIAILLLCGACASPDHTPTPEAQRNVISAGMGVASVLTDCGDGVQRDTRGAGVGFILTRCMTLAPEPKDSREMEIEGTGIVSIGLGLALTFSNCGGFRLSGGGIGLGLVAAPCPRAPRPKL